MAKHMDDADRIRIESLLKQGWNVAEIARELKRSESTIAHELQFRRERSRKGYGCHNSICSHYEECTRAGGGMFQTRPLKTSPACRLVCPAFIERVCPRLNTSPYVCNGCPDEWKCPLEKRYYIARVAQAKYAGDLSACRSGVRVSDEWIEEANDLITDGLRKGQSLSHIIASNPDKFKGVKERRLYDYVESGLFDAGRGDLPEACHRKPRRKRPETKTQAKCRVGRTYLEYLEYMKANENLRAVELDTVEGTKGGKVIFTMMFPCGLMLGFLREAKSAQTCTRLFNELWKLAGEELFREMFAVILTDNGPEFSDPGMIEQYRPDPVHNSTKLVPRGIRVFFCDPYCSSQKPHVERNHLEIRRILEKGTSFDQLTQEDIALVMSHVNSYSRPSLHGAVPYDEFCRVYGDEGREFLKKVGIVRIPANQVTLDPFLLGKKFKNHADKVIVDRYMKK